MAKDWTLQHPVADIPFHVSYSLFWRGLGKILPERLVLSHGRVSAIGEGTLSFGLFPSELGPIALDIFSKSFCHLHHSIAVEGRGLE